MCRVASRVRQDASAVERAEVRGIRSESVRELKELRDVRRVTNVREVLSLSGPSSQGCMVGLRISTQLSWCGRAAECERAHELLMLYAVDNSARRAKPP